MTIYKKFKLLINGIEFPYIQKFEPVGEELWITSAGFIEDIGRGWMGEIKIIFYEPIKEFEAFPYNYEQTYRNILCKRVEPSWETASCPTVKYIFEKE